MLPAYVNRPQLRPSGVRRLLMPLFLACGGFPGCGGINDTPPPHPKVYPVSGKVVLADGNPLKGGRVYLVPTKDSVLISSGEVGQDGTFSISTGTDEGAPAGEFKVRIEASTPPPPPNAKRGGRTDLKPLPFPQKYVDEDSSQLVVTIKPEENKLEPFQLK